MTTPSPFLRFWTAEITIFRQTAMVGQISNLSMPEIIQKLDLQDRGDRPLSTKERDPEEQRGRDRPLCAARGVVRRCRALIYRATPAENADLMSVSVYSAVGLLNMSSVSPSSTIFPFLMTMT